MGKRVRRFCGRRRQSKRSSLIGSRRKEFDYPQGNSEDVLLKSVKRTNRGVGTLK